MAVFMRESGRDPVRTRTGRCRRLAYFTIAKAFLDELKAIPSNEFAEGTAGLPDAARKLLTMARTQALIESDRMLSQVDRVVAIR
jgi:hypothetical protein